MSYFPRTMMLLLLALPVLALLPQVIPDYGAEERCLERSGHCRKKCKDGEMAEQTCKHYRVCCVLDTISNNQKASRTGTMKETTTIEYDLSSDFMDVLNIT
ncbi:beta-defensin 118 [Grammomys surdaster]|uniref:beta-defensin 118 n=1 Tax=Grammomys surdaster TaxID=491861 RepID=UPI00109F4BCA|nr:beta-defensin 118 [Grammomys surdaster]